MYRRLVEFSLVILCLECCRSDWRSTHSDAEKFKCQKPQPRSLRITELLKLNCLDDTVPAHVVLNRCDDMTGTCVNQKAKCTAIETRKITFHFQWREFGGSEFKHRTERAVDHLKCGCDNNITYDCT